MNNIINFVVLIKITLDKICNYNNDFELFLYKPLIFQDNNSITKVNTNI